MNQGNTERIGTQEERHERLEAKVDRILSCLAGGLDADGKPIKGITATVEENNHALHGNGGPGLLARMNAVEKRMLVFGLVVGGGTVGGHAAIDWLPKLFGMH